MKTNLPKIALSSLFVAVVLAVFVLANFTSTTELDYSVPDLIPGTSYPDEFVLKNDFTDFNITSLAFDFIPNSDIDTDITKQVTKSNFKNINFNTVMIGKQGGQLTVDFDFKVPEEIPAIDEENKDFKEQAWDIGFLEVTGTKVSWNTSATDGTVKVQIPVSVEVKNNLKFDNNKLELEIGDAEPKNISDGSTQNIAINEDIKINVHYHNTYNKNEDGFAFTGNNIEAKLFVEDDEVDSAEGEDDVEDGEVGATSLSLDLNDHDVGDTIELRVELKGRDNFGSLHGDIFEFKIAIQEEADTEDEEELLDSDGDGVNDDVDLCPNTPSSCIVEFDGCMIDFDGDGVPDCTGTFTKNNNHDEDTPEPKSTNVGNTKKSEQKTTTTKPETTTTPAAKKQGSDSGATSFIFGLIVGAVGTALFFILTRV